MLNNDIDCDLETLDSIHCTSVDGKGFTIKNAVIHSTDFYNDAALFSGEITHIANLNVENVKVTAEKSATASVITVSLCSSITNVHVKDSSVTCGQIKTGSGMGKSIQPTYVGGIYAGVNQQKFSDGTLAKELCDIKGCSVDNIEITVNGLKGERYNFGELFAGGIAGHSNSIENCYATNSTITVNSTSPTSDPHAGGIVANATGKVKNSYSKNCKLNANSMYYQDNGFSLYSTGISFAGGVCAYSSSKAEISYCYATENTLNLASRGGCRGGGLIGECYSKVSQSYATANDIHSDKYMNGNEGGAESRNLGGLIGYCNNASIQSCFSFGNSVSEYTPPDKKTEATACGLIGQAETTMVFYSATANNTLSSLVVDEFCANKLDKCSDCYITNQDCSNLNECKLTDELFWYSESRLREELLLIGNMWVFEQDALPKIIF